MVVNTGNDGNLNVADWFRSLPFVTRYWFSATVATTFAANFEIIRPVMLIWDWHQVSSKFELWRVLTSFLYAGAFSFPTVITVCKFHGRLLRFTILLLIYINFWRSIEKTCFTT